MQLDLLLLETMGNWNLFSVRTGHIAQAKYHGPLLTTLLIGAELAVPQDLFWGILLVADRKARFLKKGDHLGEGKKGADVPAASFTDQCSCHGRASPFALGLVVDDKRAHFCEPGCILAQRAAGDHPPSAFAHNPIVQRVADLRSRLGVHLLPVDMDRDQCGDGGNVGQEGSSYDHNAKARRALDSSFHRPRHPLSRKGQRPVVASRPPLATHRTGATARSAIHVIYQDGGAAKYQPVSGCALKG